MNFNVHSDLTGNHAFLGASNYHWLNYTEEKLAVSYLTARARERGTRIHALAAELIHLGVKLPKTTQTLNLYVNDAIGFRMKPEIVLKYTFNAFGTVDAISFNKNFLRIHDLKTGETKTSFKQLVIYAALFCLEYVIDPANIEIELRIYQSDQYTFFVPKPELVLSVMDKMRKFDERIEKLKLEEYDGAV